MNFEVKVSRKELASALARLKRATKSKIPFDVILSFADGKLSVSGLGAIVEIPASGQADADVRVESSILFNLARLLPNVDPMPITAFDNKLQLGPLSFPCEMSPRQPVELVLPINPELKDVLALRYRLSTEQVERSGFKQALNEAEEKRDGMVRKAVASLAPLGVTEEDVVAVIERIIREHAKGTK